MPKPYLVIHTSVSLDGKVTGFDVDMGVHYRLAGTFREDATLAGSDTLLVGLEAEGIQPDPEATDTSAEAADAAPSSTSDSSSILVVPDSRGRLKHWRGLLGSGHWGRGVALCTTSTPADQRAYLDRVGVAVMDVGEERVDLVRAMEVLARDHGVERVRADCGGRLAGALLHAGVVDEVSLLIHPVVAGAGQVDWYVNSEGVASPAPQLERTSLESLDGGLVWLRLAVAPGTG